MKKYLIISVIFMLLVAGGYFYVDFAKKKNIKNETEIQLFDPALERNHAEIQNTQEITKSQPMGEAPKNSVPQKIEQKVAFMVQAPFGNWKDPIFQNACEEDSMIMAMSWINGIETILAEEAQKQIKNIVDFENKKFGYNTDTDINDMQIIFRDFFHYSSIDVRENINLSDIINEIQKGNIVLVPAFGQALKNPNYRAPGPVAHMLVIIGYDPDTKKFTTNDSGTKHGKGYLYPENVLFEAIWQYPSGAKTPKTPLGTRKKGMLVVIKSQ
jgi:hypothetical protein